MSLQKPEFTEAALEEALREALDKQPRTEERILNGQRCLVIRDVQDMTAEMFRIQREGADHA